MLGRGIHQTFILGLRLTVKNWGEGSGAKLDLFSSDDTVDNLGSYIKIPVASHEVLKVDQALTVCTSAWKRFLKMCKGNNLDVILQCLTMKVHVIRIEFLTGKHAVVW